MTTLRIFLIVGVLTVLGGCASSTPRMAEVRAFAAQSPKLGAYHELAERYCSSYQRMLPYLSPAADVRERALDLERRATCKDIATLQTAVQVYMQALGKLAGDDQYDLRDQIKSVGSGIKAWPDAGIETRHVNAVAGLTRLVARAITAPAQERAVNDIMRDGQQAMQTLLDAMENLLRLYDKASDEEKALVLGMLESHLPFLDRQNEGRDRLLYALGKSEEQAKSAEYRLIGLRHTLARQNLAAIEQAHRALVAGAAP